MNTDPDLHLHMNSTSNETDGTTFKSLLFNETIAGLRSKKL